MKRRCGSAAVAKLLLPLSPGIGVATVAGAGIVAASISNGGTSRSFARGRPYTPVGTVQDFTASPHHVSLAEMQRELDDMNGRPRTHLYEGPTITTPQGPRPLFRPDMSGGPAHGGMTDDVRAARQDLMMFQSDSYGESIRGVVSPPPPPDADAPREYIQPQVELGNSWWIAVTSIVLLFVLMAKFGQ